MTLRKTAALILAAVLLFLCGCRDKKASESGEPRQMLVIGSDIYAPYFYIGENGDFVDRICFGTSSAWYDNYPSGNLGSSGSVTSDPYDFAYHDIRYVTYDVFVGCRS